MSLGARRLEKMAELSRQNRVARGLLAPYGELSQRARNTIAHRLGLMDGDTPDFPTPERVGVAISGRLYWWRDMAEVGRVTALEIEQWVKRHGVSLPPQENQRIEES